MLSVPLLIEYEAVLTRPEQLATCGMRAAEIGRVLDDLVAVATPITRSYRWRPMLPDPDDDMILEAAVNGNADAIVTFNQRDFEKARFTFQCGVILPRQALQQIRRPNP